MTTAKIHEETDRFNPKHPQGQREMTCAEAQQAIAGLSPETPEDVHADAVEHFRGCKVCTSWMRDQKVVQSGAPS